MLMHDTNLEDMIYIEKQWGFSQKEWADLENWSSKTEFFRD